MTPSTPTTGSPLPSTELPEAEAPGGALAAVGTEADWDTFILPCKDPGQEAVVQTVTTGDVTGDGVADSVVVRTCDGAKPYFPSTIEVFDGSSPARRPWRIGQPLLSGMGDRKPWVTQASVVAGEIVVKFNGYSPKVDESTNAIIPDPAKCPKFEYEYHFKLKGTEFHTSHLETGVGSDTCRPAGL